MSQPTTTLTVTHKSPSVPAKAFFLIFSLLALVMMGIAFGYSSAPKGWLWTLYALIVVLFIATQFLMWTAGTDHTKIQMAVAVGFVQLVLSIVAFWLANRGDNINGETAVGFYTTAVVLTVVSWFDLLWMMISVS